MKLRIVCLALLLFGGFVSIWAQETGDVGVVAAVAPVYPPIAAAAHAFGDVTVDVTIDASGKVTSAKAITGHPLLQAISVGAARRWKFVSAKEPNAKRTVRLTFTFLQETDLADDERTAVFLPPYKVQVAGPKVVIQRNSTH